MQNKLAKFLAQQQMLSPGDRLICAVSGGADSIALLFACYLLKDTLDFQLEAAHFNHHLRGAESDRDEAFVRDFCQGYGIPLHVSGGQVVPGEKGLEAAARDARYGFLRSLPGKVATAHTADDNAETLLMRLIRGTGLKGLGAIAPVSGNIIRPMLLVTRLEVEAFLEEWSLPHMEDSSNGTDAFLRNRIRHHIMPLLYGENPKIGENLSRTALTLREDETVLEALSAFDTLPPLETLQAQPTAIRRRCLARFLKSQGVKEPEEVHLAQVEQLVFSPNPSARASLPGGVTIGRVYDRLEVIPPEETLPEVTLPCPGDIVWGSYRIRCFPAGQIVNTPTCFTFCPQGDVVIRSRRTGDQIRLSGGTQSLKKLFIDRKIPAAQRASLPVLSDSQGVLAVYSIGVHRDRAPEAAPAVTVLIEKTNEENG